MQKVPCRPNHNITQSFNDGVIDFYSVINIAEPGYMPKEGLVFKESLRFESQRLGLSRIYMNLQNQAEIEMVVRIQKRDTISPQDVAVVNNGKQYMVDSILTVFDVWPACMDVALKRIEQKYEIP